MLINFQNVYSFGSQLAGRCMRLSVVVGHCIGLSVVLTERCIGLSVVLTGTL